MTRKLLAMVSGLLLMCLPIAAHGQTAEEARPIKSSTLTSLAADNKDPHYPMLSHSSFAENYEATGFFGIGIRVSLND